MGIATKVYQNVNSYLVKNNCGVLLIKNKASLRVAEKAKLRVNFVR